MEDAHPVILPQTRPVRAARGVSSPPVSVLFEVVLTMVLGAAAVVATLRGDPPPTRKRKTAGAPAPSAKSLELDPAGAALLDSLAAGLDLTHAGRRVEGTRKGVAIEIIAEPYGSAEPAELRCTARFESSLDIGLDVHAGTTAGLDGEAFVSPGFDAALHVEAQSAAAAQRFLRGRAGDLLLAAALEGQAPWLDDDAVGVVVAASERDAQVTSAIDRLIHIADAVNAARRKLPPKVEPRESVLGVLRAIAAHTGGEVDEGALRVEYRLTVGTVTVRVDHGSTTVRVAFSRALPGEVARSFDAVALAGVADSLQIDALHLEATASGMERSIALVDAAESAAEALAKRAATSAYR